VGREQDRGERNEPENSGDVHASRAANIHEVRVGRLDKSALLALGLFDGSVGVKQVVVDELEDRMRKRGQTGDTSFSLDYMLVQNTYFQLPIQPIQEMEVHHSLQRLWKTQEGPSLGGNKRLSDATETTAVRTGMVVSLAKR